MTLGALAWPTPGLASGWSASTQVSSCLALAPQALPGAQKCVKYWPVGSVFLCILWRQVLDHSFTYFPGPLLRPVIMPAGERSDKRRPAAQTPIEFPSPIGLKSQSLKHVIPPTSKQKGSKRSGSGFVDVLQVFQHSYETGCLCQSLGGCVRATKGCSESTLEAVGCFGLNIQPSAAEKAPTCPWSPFTMVAPLFPRSQSVRAAAMQICLGESPQGRMRQGTSGLAKHLRMQKGFF